jgi:hypothetical protein
MSFYNVILDFSQVGETWKETFYLDGSSAVADTEDDIADSLLLGLPGPALTFRPSSVQLVTISVRNVSGTRRAAIRECGAVGARTAAAASPEVRGVSATVAIGSNAGRTRHMWIRGLDDSLTRRAAGTGIVNTALMGTMLRGYLNALQQFNARTRVQTAPPVPPNDPPTIIDWQNVKSFGRHASNENWTVVQTAAGTTTLPLVGTVVYFRGLERPRFDYLRGNFSVVERDAVAGTFVVPARYREVAATVGARNTQWRKKDYTYSAWRLPPGGSIGFQLGTRDTAGPTGRRAGRRSPGTRRR